MKQVLQIVCLFCLLCIFWVFPQTDAFSKWASESLPTMIWTPEGLRMENPALTQPFTLESAKYGEVAIFDMSKTNVGADDFGKSRIIITSKKIFVKQGPQKVQGFSTIQAQNPLWTPRGVQQPPSRVRVTGNVLEGFYNNIKGIAFVFVMFFFFLAAFFVGLLGNLLYSILGLLANLIRKSKLKYGAIFNLTCFATTVGFTYTCFKAFLPFLPYSIPLITILNIIYMVVFFKITDQEAKA